MAFFIIGHPVLGHEFGRAGALKLTLVSGRRVSVAFEAPSELPSSHLVPLAMGAMNEEPPRRAGVIAHSHDADANAGARGWPSPHTTVEYCNAPLRPVRRCYHAFTTFHRLEKWARGAHFF
jgi:hypothetical protein